MNVQCHLGTFLHPGGTTYTSELDKGQTTTKTTGTSQVCASNEGQVTTTTTVSTAGCTVTIEHLNQGDKSARSKKTDDKLEREKELDAEGQKEVETEVHEEGTDDEEPEDEPSIVKFEDPVYKLSQAYEMEPEYESMTAEQEAAEV